MTRANAILVCGPALAMVACLPPYEFVPDESRTSSGGGDAATASAVTSSTAEAASSSSGGMVGPLGPAGSGPYGAPPLFFGAAEEEALELPDALELHGMVSPDGLRLTRRWHPLGDGGVVAEHVRPGLTSVWSVIDLEHPIRWDVFSHLSADNLSIFSCHGGDLKCLVHGRSDLASDFEVVAYFQEQPPFDGDAEDLCFVPTPDQRFFAFCSNRISATDDSNSEGSRRLWTTRPLDVTDLGAGFETPELVTGAGFPDDMDPTWFDDEGLTIVFHSNEGATSDLYVASRPAVDAPFDEPVRIDALSDDTEEDYFFSMPSLEVLRSQPASQGYAYFQRGTSFMRVPVCVGAPCD